VAYHIRFAERQDMGNHYFFKSLRFSFNYFMSFEQGFDPLEKSEASLPVQIRQAASFFDRLHANVVM
jgi:hypothetical protein